MNKIVIQYQTHKVQTNKNSLTEINRQLPKVETPITKQHTIKQYWADTNTRTKSKSRKFKENYEWGKDYVIMYKKYRMENSQDGNGKK